MTRNASIDNSSCAVCTALQLSLVSRRADQKAHCPLAASSRRGHPAAGQKDARYVCAAERSWAHHLLWLGSVLLPIYLNELEIKLFYDFISEAQSAIWYWLVQTGRAQDALHFIAVKSWRHNMAPRCFHWNSLWEKLKKRTSRKSLVRNHRVNWKI